MRRLIMAITMFGLLFACTVHAKQMYREKTFSASLCPETTRALLWTNLMQQVDMVSKRRFGGRLQGVTSAFVSNLDDDFSQYFGMFNPMANAVQSFIGIDQADPNELLSSMNFFHDYARSGNTYPGYGVKERIALQPQKRSVSFMLDYVHGFDTVFEGLSFRISAPFVAVKTSMHPKTLIPDSRGMNLPGTGTHVTVAEYLAGDVANTDPANYQAALTHLKIPRGYTEIKGFGDVEVALRVRPWRNDGSHLDIGIKAIFPIGHKLKGDVLFEPTRGNNGHNGIGLEGLLDFLAYENDDFSVELVLNADCTYLFPADELRVPLFYDAQGNIPPFAQYQLGGRLGVAGMFPMANVLATMFKVSPGHKVEATLSCITSNKGLSLELGAGAKARSAEVVEVIKWEDDSVGVVGWSYDATSPVTTNDLWSTASSGPDGTAINAATNLRTVNASNLALSSITTPSMLMGYTFCFVGYSYADWRYPLSFGMGMVRELSMSSNAMAPSWNVFFKFGATF